MGDLVERRWGLGALVKKKRNSDWRGVIVGFYSTESTPFGYSVKSLFENGSVQVWPEVALEDWDGSGTPEELAARIRELEAQVAALREFVSNLASNPRKPATWMQTREAAADLLKSLKESCHE